MRELWYRILIVLAVVFAIGGALPPQVVPRAMEKIWEVPTVNTIGKAWELTFGSAKNHTWVGRLDPKDHKTGDLKLNEPALRKEAALADRRVDGRTQYRSFWFMLAIICLALALWIRPRDQIATAANGGSPTSQPSNLVSGLAVNTDLARPGAGGAGGPTAPNSIDAAAPSDASASVETPAPGGPSGGASTAPAPKPDTVTATGPAADKAPAPETPADKSVPIRVEGLKPGVEESCLAEVASTQEHTGAVQLTLIWSALRPDEKPDTRVLHLEGEKLADANTVSIDLKGMRSEGMPTDVYVRLG